jgi:HKD family nuclease
MNILIQPFSEKTLGEFLKEVFDDRHGQFESFQAAVAYAKKSGVQHLEDKIRAFINSGKKARIIVGIDQQGTSVEGLESLLSALNDHGELFINHDENSFVTFHPKIYYFEGKHKALLVIGSGNLTQGGLYSNDEGFSIIQLNPSSEADRDIIEEVHQIFDKWCDDGFGTVRPVDRTFVDALKESGYIISEYAVIGGPEAEPGEADENDGDSSRESTGRTPLFGRGAGRRRPPRSRETYRKRRQRPPFYDGPLFESEPRTEPSHGFVMTLMKTDVGVGQTTRGTSRRSPEIFIPLAARDANPDFWGWDEKFTEDGSKPGKFDRRDVRFRLAGDIISVNMMTWPDKHDFRIRSETLRSAGEINDLIRIEKTEQSGHFDYYVEIIPPGTSDYDYYNDFCVNAVRNSTRRWGYY